MSAKYFLPYCVVNTYLLDTVEQAENCGLINGILYAFLISLVIIFFTIRFYIRLNPVYRSKFLMFIGIILLILWIWLPLSFKSGYNVLWTGYTNVINSLLSLGYTRFQAISILQSANSSGDILSGSIISSASGGLIALSPKNKNNSPSPST